MSFLSAQTLAGIRAVAEKALVDRCSILRPFSGTDGGYRKGGHQTVASDVPCRLMKQTQRDVRGMVMDREAGTTYWKLALPHVCAIRDGDSVQLNGLTYEVLQVYAANTEKVFVEAQVARIERPTNP